MSILDVWADKFIPAIVQTITSVTDANGEATETKVDGATIWGVKYNRSEAARYFSQTWAMDITDVFVTDSSNGLHKDDELKIDGVLWACDEPVNVLEMGEVYTTGLRRKA
jgi:hypothetical protein